METITSTAPAVTTKESTPKYFQVKCYKKKDLSVALGFKNVRQFDYALKSIDDPEKIKKHGWYYTPKQVEAIIRHVGFDRIRHN